MHPLLPTVFPGFAAKQAMTVSCLPPAQDVTFFCRKGLSIPGNIGMFPNTGIDIPEQEVLHYHSPINCAVTTTPPGMGSTAMPTFLNVARSILRR